MTTGENLRGVTVRNSSAAISTKPADAHIALFERDFMVRDHFNRVTISSKLQTWSETPASIAGVTRKVWYQLTELSQKSFGAPGRDRGHRSPRGQCQYREGFLPALEIYKVG